MSNFWRTRWGEALQALLIPLGAVVLALLLGIAFILWAGQDPRTAYGALFQASFGSWRDFSETLVVMTPLIFTGLSVAFAFRTGLFNIGGEGQYLVGGFAAAVVGYTLAGLPGILHVTLVILAAALFGGLWGLTPGLLKARLGIHEVITTIMLNYIGLFLTNYLVLNVFRAEGPLPVTPTILETAQLWRFSPPNRVHTGIFIALAAAAVVYWLLWKTVWGYEIRAVGQSQGAAEYGGISVSRNLVLAMVVAGALSGLAGGVQVAGLQLKFYQSFGFVGYGFDGIAVALLGRNHPAGVIPAALLFAILARGASRMQGVGVPEDIAQILQAIIIFLVAADQIVRWLLNWNRKKRREQVA